MRRPPADFKNPLFRRASFLSSLFCCSNLLQLSDLKSDLRSFAQRMFLRKSEEKPWRSLIWLNSNPPRSILHLWRQEKTMKCYKENRNSIKKAVLAAQPERKIAHLQICSKRLRFIATVDTVYGPSPGIPHECFVIYEPALGRRSGRGILSWARAMSRCKSDLHVRTWNGDEKQENQSACLKYIHAYIYTYLHTYIHACMQNIMQS